MIALGIVYSILAATLYLAFRLARLGKLNSPARRWLAILAIGCATTLANVGPIGLILGLPSIMISSILVSVLLNKEKLCDTDSTSGTSS